MTQPALWPGPHPYANALTAQSLSNGQAHLIQGVLSTHQVSKGIAAPGTGKKIHRRAQVIWTIVVNSLQAHQAPDDPLWVELGAPGRCNRSDKHHAPTEANPLKGLLDGSGIA